MAKALFHSLRRAPSLVKPYLSLNTFSLRPIFHSSESVFSPLGVIGPPNLPNPPWIFRNLSHGTVNLVISEGKPKFEMHEVNPPKKEKWQTKKRLKMQRKREKQMRKDANKRRVGSLSRGRGKRNLQMQKKELSTS